MIHKNMKGFSLLFTLLIISLMFSVSLGVYNLIIGEIRLSGTGRESQLAFWAADSAAECALLWDIKPPGLAKSAFATSSQALINCAGQTKTVGGSPLSSYSLSFESGSCASVTVEKNSSETIVISQGQNTCGAGRAVQRGIKVSY